MRHWRPAPLWWYLLVAAIAAACQWTAGSYDAPAPVVALAFWGWLASLASLVWNGLHAAVDAVVAGLVATVNALWIIVKATADGLAFAGRELLDGFRGSWDFLRGLYEHVLKRAWRKLWDFVEWARAALDRIFRPVFRVLLRVRSELLKFYTRWVRPILDAIDIARKMLRVFSSLGVAWATALDQQLARIAEQIDAPFRRLLRELNQVINLVNRVVTANGLFQRLALIRSIERDIRYVSRAFVNWRSRPLSDQDYDALRARAGARTLEDVTRDTEEALLTGGGAYGPFVREMTAQWTQYLAERPGATGR